LRNASFKVWLLQSLFFYSIFLLPLHISQYIHYGDPLSPALAPYLKPEGYEYVSDFLHGLKIWTEKGFSFPLGLFFPKSIGTIPTILGMGFFSVLLIQRGNSKSRQYLLFAVILFGAVALLGQRTSRFFMEAYLFLILAVASATSLNRWVKPYSYGITFQLLGVLASLLVGVGVLLPGAFSFGWRDYVMNRTADEYSSMQWLDEQLSEDVFLISDMGANALLPRPFVVRDYALMMKYNHKTTLKFLKKEARQRKVYLIRSSVLSDNHVLSEFVDSEAILYESFKNGTRNPLNRNQYTMYVYPVRF
jgi:hypothetical protein